MFNIVHFSSRRARGLIDLLTIYSPLILMGVLAMLTYWLVRSSPGGWTETPAKTLSHDPDYVVHDFSLQTFDPVGQSRTIIYGKQAKHFPDTDTFEIAQPLIRKFTENGVRIQAQAAQAITNADGSQAQLIGDAEVLRSGMEQSIKIAKTVIKSDFLDFYLKTEEIKSSKPVHMEREKDKFDANSMYFDNLNQQMLLIGRVHGVLQAKPAAHP
jgi:lipopolysaccharide export system protein LptC